MKLNKKIIICTFVIIVLLLFILTHQPRYINCTKDNSLCPKGDYLSSCGGKNCADLIYDRKNKTISGGCVYDDMCITNANVNTVCKSPLKLKNCNGMIKCVDDCNYCKQIIVVIRHTEKIDTPCYSLTPAGIQHAKSYKKILPLVGKYVVENMLNKEKFELEDNDCCAPDNSNPCNADTWKPLTPCKGIAPADCNNYNPPKLCCSGRAEVVNSDWKCLSSCCVKTGDNPCSKHNWPGNCDQIKCTNDKKDNDKLCCSGNSIFNGNNWVCQKADPPPVDPPKKQPLNKVCPFDIIYRYLFYH